MLLPIPPHTSIVNHNPPYHTSPFHTTPCPVNLVYFQTKMPISPSNEPDNKIHSLPKTFCGVWKPNTKTCLENLLVRYQNSDIVGT